MVSGSITPATPALFTLVGAATTNATVVNAAATTFLSARFDNPTASDVFVKLYNKATAPTVGTDIPVVTYKVLAGTALDVVLATAGRRFGTGLGLAITGLRAAADTTAVAAGVEVTIDRY